jgi:hypothetical protein
MNQAVGTVCAAFASGSGHAGVPNVPVNGPWLDSNHGHKAENPYHTYGKMSASSKTPGPAKIWVLIDESTVGLNDGGFGFGMVNQEWVDFPGWYHNGACGFAFMDAHSEIHKWRGNVKFPPGTTGRPPANIDDWRWMCDHTSGR